MKFAKQISEAYEGDGIQVNSGQFNGLPNSEAKIKIAEWMDYGTFRHPRRRTQSFLLGDVPANLRQLDKAYHIMPPPAD